MMDNLEDWKPYAERKIPLDNELSYKICEMLNLDPDKTHSILISADDNSITICELTDEAYKAMFPNR